MLRLAVCDDDSLILTELGRALRAAFERHGIPCDLQTFESVGILWEAWKKNSFDVLFLDVDMPGMDGIDFVRFLQAHGMQPCIVFISGREERVFEAFQVSALRFMRKSRFWEEIDDTVLAVAHWHAERNAHSLVIESRTGIRSLAIKEILYVECFAKTQRIVTLNGSCEVKHTLTEMEEKLKSCGFLRPHKGYLVNYRYIESIDGTSLLMKNGSRVPVSKYKIREIKQSYLHLTTQELSLRLSNREV